MVFHRNIIFAKRRNFSGIYKQWIDAIKVVLLLVLLSACVPLTSSVTAIPLTPISASPAATITSTIVPTILPTQTPTLKHFGECPDVQEDLIPDFSNAFEQTNLQDLVTPVLSFLNQGGSPQAVVEALQDAERSIFDGDLTGDGVPELVMFDRHITILACVSQKYETSFTLYAEFGWNDIISAQDMNLNGIPDLVVHNPSSCGPMWNCSEAYIYEWDGQQFQNIVQTGDYDRVTMTGPFAVRVADIDGNGTQELIANGGIPTWFVNYADGIPWREQSDTYIWNGKAFVLSQTEFSAPEYIFQAVQDGDRATLRGDYKKALSHYQQAVSDSTLEWWTQERNDYEEANLYSDFGITYASVPQPVPDPAEKTSLVAYAQYRIMLLYLLQEMDLEAQIAYNMLVKQFPEGQAGHSYVEMANAFWNEYQVNSNVKQACVKATEYASKHQTEILKYLGNTSQSYWHGQQSLEYNPSDICPFDN